MRQDSPIVLVIEDDDAVREYAVKALSRLGYAATGAADAQAALEIATASPSIRLILSDVCLTSGTGPEVVRQALRHRPDLKVIFMTGGFDGISFRRTDPVIPKPFRIQQLHDMVKSALDDTKRPAETRRASGVERRRPPEKTPEA